MKASALRVAASGLISLAISACSLFVTRPVQEMADSAASIRAAREVQADVLAPELYRQATETFQKAKREYRFKNFREARILADQTRNYAEMAEYEAIRNGATRGDAAAAGGVDPYSDSTASVATPPAPPPAKPAPYDYPKPQPIPATEYDNQNNAASPKPVPSP